jgi:hypothetical protein
MKNLSILLFVFLISFSGIAQSHIDHPVFMKYAWKDNNQQTRDMTDRLINETDSGLYYILYFEKEFSKYERQMNAYGEKLEHMENSFDKTYVHPEETSLYRRVMEYESQLKGMQKENNRYGVLITMAETAYNLCINNQYSVDCSSQRNNYNNLVYQQNALVNRYEQTHRIYLNKLSDYNDYVDEYQIEEKYFVSQYNTLNDDRNRYDSQTVSKLNGIIGEIDRYRKQNGIN